MLKSDKFVRQIKDGGKRIADLVDCYPRAFSIIGDFSAKGSQREKYAELQSGNYGLLVAAALLLDLAHCLPANGLEI